MPANTTNLRSAPHYLRQLSTSRSWHSVLVILLGIIMLFLLGLTHYVIQQQQQVQYNVDSEMIRPQNLIGPILVVPFVDRVQTVESTTDDNGEIVSVFKNDEKPHTAILLPDHLVVRADLDVAEPAQGDKAIPSYTANLNLSGAFNHQALLDQPVEGDLDLQWEQAFIALGLSDTRGIQNTSGFFWNNTRIAPQPGSGLPELLNNGIHIPLSEASGTTQHEFKFEMKFQGSQGLQVAPLGEQTRLRLGSNWQYPQLNANSLQPQVYEHNEQGFNSEWDISWLARNYPQYWLAEEYSPDLRQLLAGVNLQGNSATYEQILQLLPYGIMFTSLVFLLLLAFELRQNPQAGLRLMPYAIIGVLLNAFYLLLLAINEHFPFLYAYIGSSIFLSVVISVYVRLTWRSTLFALFIACCLASLYALQYFLLELQAYQFLSWVVVLLCAIGILMYISAPTASSDTQS